MSQPSMPGRLAAFLLCVANGLAPAAALLTRLAFGHAFLLTGHGKWANFNHTVEFFTSLGIPAPTANAAFIATLELVGGAALILGLGTRLFAALLSSTMVVAMLTADRGALLDALAGRGDQGPTDITPFVFFMALAWLVTHGAGAWSLDRFLAPRVRQALGMSAPAAACPS